MKLNAEIIFNELSKRYDVEFYRNGSKDLLLSKPEFYMDDEQVFFENHLYLATVEHLPQRPRIQRNVVLVCIGDGMTLNYYKDRLSLILIRNRADFFKVFRVLQNTFEKYDDWERSLFNGLIGEKGISSMAADSEEIFNTPVYVIDKEFRFVATSKDARNPDWVQDGRETLNSESFSKFLNAENMMTERRNAFILNVLSTVVLCVNLFNKYEEYEGCLCLDMKGREPEPGMDILAEHLASFIELAFERSPYLQSESQASMKGLIQTLVEEQPLSRSQRVMLSSVNESQPYLCVYFRSTEKFQQLPLNYICGVFEESLKESYAFVYDEGIIGIINLSEINRQTEEKHFDLELTRSLREFCKKMRLCAGVSGEFSDLFSIRVHFLQARAALEDGKLLNEDDRLFYFSSYALTEMIINSLGGLPAEAYFPAGLKAIFEHDKRSSVSYLDTLKMFIEENLSYTSTAQKLFIHRSTLIDRIDRIEREMNIDLKNPEQRLQIEILLKAMELEEVMRR